MTSLDYFYENILTPIAEEVGETVRDLVTSFVEWSLMLLYFITIPLWIVPYSLTRHRRNKRRVTDESAD